LHRKMLWVYKNTTCIYKMCLRIMNGGCYHSSEHPHGCRDQMGHSVVSKLHCNKARVIMEHRGCVAQSAQRLCSSECTEVV